MRPYLLISALGMTLYLSTPLAQADDYFGDFQQSQPQTPSASAGKSSGVLSPSEFAARVNQLNQQSNQRLSNQAAQILPPPKTVTRQTLPQTPVSSPATTTTPTGSQPANYNGFGAAPSNGSNSGGKSTSGTPASNNWDIQY